MRSFLAINQQMRTVADTVLLTPNHPFGKNMWLLHPIVFEAHALLVAQPSFSATDSPFCPQNFTNKISNGQVLLALLTFQVCGATLLFWATCQMEWWNETLNWYSVYTCNAAGTAIFRAMCVEKDKIPLGDWLEIDSPMGGKYGLCVGLPFRYFMDARKKLYQWEDPRFKRLIVSLF